MQKIFFLKAVILIALAPAFLTWDGSSPKAKAQIINAEDAPSGVISDAQSNYQTISSNDWLNPLIDVPLNEPITVENETGSQYSAVLSRNVLSAPPLGLAVPARQYEVVTQWNQNNLQVYAYEIRKDCGNSRSFNFCSSPDRTVIDPTAVGTGLIPIPRMEQTCTRGFRSPGACTVPEAPMLAAANQEAPQVEVKVIIDGQEFTLTGREGVFPINNDLIQALRSPHKRIEITIPVGSRAEINGDAVRSLQVLYQEPSR